MSNIKVAPSLLSADPANLEAEVASVKDAGADLLHLDIMDGHFVPSLTYGPLTAERLCSFGLPLDIHLMVDNPEEIVPLFLPYASYLTVHVEATPHLHRILRSIRDHGVKAGVALNPSTSPETVSYVMDLLDLVTVMAVNPVGRSEVPHRYGPQSRGRRSMVRSSGLPVDIEVDGGSRRERGFVRFRRSDHPCLRELHFWSIRQAKRHSCPEREHPGDPLNILY